MGRRLGRVTRRRGAMLILMAVAMVVFLVAASFSINVAYMQLVRTELRAATDAAAKAGALQLADTQSQTLARDMAVHIAAQNQVSGAPLVISASDVVLGASTPSSGGEWGFNPATTTPNAVQVNAHMDQGSVSGAVSMLIRVLNTEQYFEPAQTATAAQLERDIMVVLDRSGSMSWDLSGAEFSYPPGGGQCLPPVANLSRWSAAVAGAKGFLSELNTTRPYEKVGLVTYASPGTWCGESYHAADLETPLTYSYGNIGSALDHCSSEPLPGGTSISSGLDLAIQQLLGANSRPLAYKSIVLLTDGVHNYGPAPINSAYTAAANHITIHTITYSAGADQAQMQQVAAATGGNHYHAPDGASLAAIFKEIAKTLAVTLTD